MNKDGRYLATVYVSLAMSYSDVKNFDQAVELYLVEMKVRDGDMREVFYSSWSEHKVE